MRRLVPEVAQWTMVRVLAASVLAGCAARSTGEQPPAGPPASAASAQGPTDASGKDGNPLPAQASGDRTTPRAEPLLGLPSNPEFLRTPLPPLVTDRYASWREVERVEVGQSHLMEVDRLPSGRLIALSQAEGKVRIYDRKPPHLDARHDVQGFQEFDQVAVLAWPVGPDRFVLGTKSGLAIHDADSGALISAVDATPATRLRWSADRRVLMALGPGASERGSIVRFFSRDDGSALVSIGQLAFEERVDAWDLGRDGRLLAVAQYPSGRLRVLDLHAGGRELYAGSAPRYAGDVAFSPDGRFLAAAGDGLLVVDLVNPERLAFYSHVKNNMGHVRFTPSGDAVVASSYDGKIRILGIDVAASGLTLTLLRELSHAGDANVYAFAFSPAGDELASASGDRTLRVFAGKRADSPARPAQSRTFHDLSTWRALEPDAARPLPAVPRNEGSALVLESERGPVRPSRVAPGTYACKISLIYKLRTCWVRRDAEGRTHLEFADDNLLHLGGVLWDDGPAVRFEAKLLTPSNLLDCAGCDRQPLNAILRGQGGKYTGLLTFRQYYDPHVSPPLPPLDARIEEANDRFPLVLEYRGPLEEEDSAR